MYIEIKTYIIFKYKIFIESNMGNCVACNKPNNANKKSKGNDFAGLAPGKQ